MSLYAVPTLLLISSAEVGLMTTRLNTGFWFSCFALIGAASSAPVVMAQSAGSTPATAAQTRAWHPAVIKPSASPYVRHLKADETQHEVDFYELKWGVDSLDVKPAESGQMIRFSYRILDPVRAKQLNDKAATPLLVDETAHVKLEIPTMEKVGQLRQTTAPEAGKLYWMVFSNKGKVVKPGDRVNILIGKFQATGLYVR